MDEFDKREAETKKLFAEMNSKSQLRASVKFSAEFKSHSEKLKCYATVSGDMSESRYAVVLSIPVPFEGHPCEDGMMFHSYVSRAFTFGSQFTLWSGHDCIGNGKVIDNRV